MTTDKAVPALPGNDDSAPLKASVGGNGSPTGSKGSGSMNGLAQHAVEALAIQQTDSDVPKGGVELSMEPPTAMLSVNDHPETPVGSDDERMPLISVNGTLPQSSSAEPWSFAWLCSEQLQPGQLSNLKRYLLLRSMLLVLAGLGCSNYWGPAKGLKSGKEPYSQELYPPASVICAGFVLYNSIELYFMTRQRGEPWRGIAAAAFVASVPLALVSWQYKMFPEKDVAENIAWVVVMQVINTFLHLFPVKLMGDAPTYRFPILPFELLAKSFYRHFYVSEQDRAIAVQEKAIKSSAAGFKKVAIALSQAKQRHFEWHFTHKDALLSPSNRPFKLVSSSAAYEAWRQFVSLVGGVFVMLSCAGYYPAPVRILAPRTGLTAAWILSSPSIYLLSALLFFFGASFFPRGSDFIRSIVSSEQRPRLPFVFKLIPKNWPGTFSAFCTVALAGALFLSFYSYAAAYEMAKLSLSFSSSDESDLWGNDIPKWVTDYIAPIFAWTALIGVRILSLGACIDIAKTMLMGYARTQSAYRKGLKEFDQFGQDQSDILGTADAKFVENLAANSELRKNQLGSVVPKSFSQELFSLGDDQKAAWLFGEKPKTFEAVWLYLKGLNTEECANWMSLEDVAAFPGLEEPTELSDQQVFLKKCARYFLEKAKVCDQNPINFKAHLEVSVLREMFRIKAAERSIEDIKASSEYNDQASGFFAPICTKISSVFSACAPSPAV